MKLLLSVEWKDPILLLLHIAWSSYFSRYVSPRFATISLKVMTFLWFLITNFKKDFRLLYFKEIVTKTKIGSWIFSLSRGNAVSRRPVLHQNIEPCWFCASICRMLTSGQPPHFYNWGKWGLERWICLFNVTREGSNRARIRAWAETYITMWQCLINQAVWLWRFLSFIQGMDHDTQVPSLGLMRQAPRDKCGGRRR